ncbi:zinc-finger associated domain (zf-AD) domain-containing protein [Phthorimaea operculella]|nr:zinc-finger associated domain (zf-AD) domain-containing protein [Phthorimaea operculella]
MDNSCLLDLLIRCFAMTEPEDLNFTAFTDLCRLCSLKSGPRLHIFDKESEQRQILFKLRTCLPTMQISKDDFLPKKICERCVTRLEQLYEWRQSCLSTDSVLRNYAESMRIVTSTINFQVRV